MKIIYRYICGTCGKKFRSWAKSKNATCCNRKLREVTKSDYAKAAPHAKSLIVKLVESQSLKQAREKRKEAK